LLAAGDWSLRNWRPVSALSTLLLVALCAFVGYWSDYTRIFPALGGPNATLYDLTLKLSQSWRREIPTLSTVFVAIDEASLATPELAALPRTFFQPVWARLFPREFHIWEPQRCATESDDRRARARLALV
jgi:hypothetical protein